MQCMHNTEDSEQYSHLTFEGGMESQNNGDRNISRNIVISFCVFTLGIVLNFSGYLSVLNLQSSINIEDGVGAATVTATYVTAAVFGITITPVMIRKFGPKACVLISEFTYALYVLVNYYPVSYVLIPAGAIVGVGEATLWPTMVMFVVYYAKNFATKKNKNPQQQITRFLGYFYFAFQFSGVFGNLISYGLLFAGKVPLNSTNSSDYTYCGSQDCQDPDIIQGNQDQYQPASATTLNIVIGVMAGLIGLAMIIHFMFAQNFGSEELDEEGSNKQREKGSVALILTTVTSTVKHIINPKALLITPLTIYIGLLISFGFLELTRAYGSCVLGVDEVGLLMAILGVCAAFSSYLGSKIASKFGRNVIFVAAFCLDCTLYIVCLLWTPTEETVWLVYVLFGILGTSSGLSQPIISGLHSYYFPDSQDIALVVWNLWTLVGIAIQTAWSTSLCVYVKIYIQISLLCVGMLGYVLSQYIYYGKKTNDDEEMICKSTAL